MPSAPPSPSPASVASHPVLATDQHGRAVAGALERHGGANGGLLLALGEHDALGLGAHLLGDPVERVRGRVEPAGQRAGVAAEIRERAPGDAGVHRRLRHGGRDAGDEPGVEGVGDDVVGAEVDVARGGPVHLVRHVLAGQRREGLGRRDLHGVVDRARAHVERAAEDVGEAEHVVDLVRVVAAPGRDDRVGCCGARRLGRDLGIRVGHGEQDWFRRHGPDHLGRDGALDGETEERVRALQRLGEGAPAGLDGVGALPLVHALLAPAIDDALGVAEDHVAGRDAHGLEELRAGDGGGPGPVDHEPGLPERAPREVAGVDEASGRDDGGAVLVVVEDGDVHQLAQPVLDDEALRRLDVLEVDAAEAAAQEAHAVDELVHVLGRDFEVDAVHVGEPLEQGDLALHDGLGGQRAEVAQAQDGGAVRDDGDHVAAGGVFVGERRVAVDAQAGFGDAGRVGEAEVARGDERLADSRLQLARPPLGVEGERLLGGDARAALLDAAVGHGGSPCCRLLGCPGAPLKCLDPRGDVHVAPYAARIRS